MPLLPPAVIVDVDGTLADVSSIRHHILLTHPDNPGYRDFDAFHKASVWVPPIHATLDTVRGHRARGLGVLVVTARMEKWRHHTQAWLESHDVHWDELHHRPDWDTRPDSLVKADILADLRTRWTVTAAIDDNPNVIALWEAEGIPTTVVPGWLDDPTGGVPVA